MFVDRVEIEVTGGKGGDGCLSFRRERHVPRGGPDGGDGGDGGSILIEAREDVDNLMALSHRKFWKARRGLHGSGSRRRGRNGEDIVIAVPPGTVVRDLDGGFVLRDLAEVGESVVAARGGKGGKGNWRFKSAVNQAPRDYTLGTEGEQRRLQLELKVIADVGLIGKPNAGKSTLLSRVTRARPEIANYPFTTKYPNLGRVVVDFDRSFVMADIPGLIEGAHEGVGLGHEFLRHVERAGLLVHLVEPLPMDNSTPVENYQHIREELQKYDAELGRRPEIVVVTKAELPGAAEVREELAAAIRSQTDREESHEADVEDHDGVGQDVLLISAVTGQGLNQLTQRIAAKLEEMSRA